MAAKRISSSSIDWNEMRLRVAFQQRFKFEHFKTLSDNYVKRVRSLPEKVPDLNWDNYFKNIKVPGLVDTFHKQYDALRIPYPADKFTNLVDEQEKVVDVEIAAFKKESLERIQKYKVELERVNSLLPYDQMTFEDFNESHPQLAFPDHNKPLFWPNSADEQIDFRDKGHPLYGSGPSHH